MWENERQEEVGGCAVIRTLLMDAHHTSTEIGSPARLRYNLRNISGLGGIQD